MSSKNNKVIFTILLAGITQLANGQKGNNDIQLAAQLSFPTGDLKELAKMGHGYSVKGLWGIGKAPQQLTTEAGYSFFDIKDRWLTQDVHAYYGGFSLYGGYRYRFGSFFIEPQAGMAVYTLNGYNSVAKQGLVDTKTYFDVAAGAGYSLNHFDLMLRYQSAQVANSTDITFVALRLGYRFFIGKKQ